MDLGKENIGDLLKNGLDGFKVNPDPAVWDKIEQNIGYKNFDQLNGDAVRNVKVSPNEGLWARISRKLWFYNFLRLTPNQLNIYYVIAGLISISAIAYLISDDNGTVSNEAYIAESITSSASSEGVSFVEAPATSGSNSENISVNKNEAVASFIPEDETIVKETSQVHDASVSNTQPSSHVSGVNLKAERNKRIGNPDDEENISLVAEVAMPDNAESVTQQASGIEDNVVESEVFVPAVIEKNSLHSGVLGSAVESDNLVEKTEEVNALVELKMDAGSVSAGNTVGNDFEETILSESEIELKSDENASLVLEHSPEDISESLPNESEIHDLEGRGAVTLEGINNARDLPSLTMQPVAESVPDTVAYDKDNNPITIESDHWSLNLFGSSGYAKSQLYTDYNEFGQYVSIREGNESQSLNFLGSFGGDFSYTHKNILFQSGINVARFGEAYKYSYHVFLEDAHYDIFERGYYQTDTVWIVQVDSMLGGVTYLVPHLEQSWITTTDSTLVTSTDTLDLGLITSQNQYTYVEVPLSLGYEVRRDKLTYTIKAGVTAGMFVDASGKTLSMDDIHGVDNITGELPFNKFRYNATFGLGVAYDITSRIGVFGEFFYRHPLNYVYQPEYYFNQKLSYAGYKLGVRISLDREESWNRFLKGLK